ncbi:hybrid sensor histidine kinase/response regulator transcription factor [Bacteroides sp.]
MKRSCTILLFCLFCYLLPIEAYYYKTYQVGDGLSHNSVWATMQDSKGFMWFGTNDGLNRFDGKNFKTYRNIQGDTLSLGNNFIHCLKEDSKGRFLIGTKQGLYLFNPDLENFRHIHLLKDESKDDVSINTIIEDPDGNIWLGCHGYGLYILNPDLSIRKHYVSGDKPNGLPSNFLWTIAQDFYGNIWLGSVGGGLIFFDWKKEMFVPFDQKQEFGITDPTIYSLYCDTDNNLWIGTASSGLIRYNYRTQKVTCFLSDALNIKSITEYSENELIMGSDKGLIIFDRIQESQSFINSSTTFDNLNDNSIFSITKDREGSFWIGTYFGGVNYYSPEVNRFLYCYSSPQNSFKKNIISGFAEDGEGNIWVGTHNDGLYLFTPQTMQLKKNYALNYHDVQSILVDRDKLYVSLYGNDVTRFRLSKGDLRLERNLGIATSGNTIISIFKSSQGTVYFTSERGVDYLDKSGEIKTVEKLRGVPIKSVTEDYEGSIWFATHSRGISRLTADGKWEVYIHNNNDSESLSCNNVNCIFQDSQYRIWIGTEGEGISLFNPEEHNFTQLFNDRTGLPSNIVYSILDDVDGNLWVSTGGGLVKITSDLKTLRSYRYSFGELPKIQYNLNCALRASNNYLYFGGTNGFVMFNPREISDNQYRPNIVISNLKIADRNIRVNDGQQILSKSIENTEEIRLTYSQSTFSFDFVSLSYISPEQNQYAYMLEGFDKEWHYSTENRVHYMNIPEGRYKFRVKGSNNDGVWSNKEAVVAIHITPPFWRSVAMLLFYFLVLNGIAFYLIRRYHRFIARKNEEQMYKYQVAKEKEVYELKINFFTNVTHEIRTPLSLIVAPLEKIILSGDGNESTRRNLDIIKHNADRLLDLVNQLLDFRKAEENMLHFNFKRQNISKIVEKVYRQFQPNAQFKKIEMELEIPEDAIECSVDGEAIYKIISNLVSNAIKFANKSICIKVFQEGEQVQVQVRDDGTGIQADYQQKIFEPFFQVPDSKATFQTGSGIGLSLSQSLAAKHNGRVMVESIYGQGSVFTLQLPVSVIEEDEKVTQSQVLLPEPEQKNVPDSKFRILIVEDNDELRAFVKDCLSDDFQTFDSYNGVEALKVLETESVDLIISDILMPEMDGLELCNAIKTDPAYSHLPVILLSAKTDTKTKIEGLNKGADIYLEKPFSIEQLRAQIYSIIENRNKLRENFIKSPLQYLTKNAETDDESTLFVEKLNKIILENMSDEEFTIDNLSGYFSISRSNFHKKIKSITGMTPNDYIKLLRLNKSAEMLSTGKYKINEVCYLVGFNTPSYFSKCFYEHFGKLPKDFIQDLS